MEAVGFIAEDVSQDPDSSQIGDPVKLHGAFEMKSGRNVPSHNKSVFGCDYVNVLRKLATLRYLPDLHVAHAEIAQAIRIALDTAHSLLGDSTRKGHRSVSVVSHSTGHTRDRRQIPGEHRQRFRPIKACQLLVFLDLGSDRVVESLPDKTLHPGVDPIHSCVFWNHMP